MSLMDGLVGAVVGSLLTAIPAWLIGHQQVKYAKQQARAAADTLENTRLENEKEKRSAYLEALASTLEKMAEEFEKALIPYSAGNTFAMLLEQFRRSFDNDELVQVENEWNELNELLQNARTLDKIYTYQIKDPDLKERTIVRLRRMAGRLRGMKHLAT